MLRLGHVGEAGVAQGRGIVPQIAGRNVGFVDQLDVPMDPQQSATKGAQLDADRGLAHKVAITSAMVIALICEFRWPENTAEFVEQELRFRLGWVWKNWRHNDLTKLLHPGDTSTRVMR